jgi:hypothetical protein
MDITRKELEEEIAEKSADLQTLLRARDVIWTRCIEVRDHSKSRLTPFHEWAGTHSLMNSFDVFINNATRTVEELQALRENAPPESPRLRVVRNDDE